MENGTALRAAGLVEVGLERIYGVDNMGGDSDWAHLFQLHSLCNMSSKSITKREVENLLRSDKKLGEFVDTLFKHFDTDGGGTIGSDELYSALEESARELKEPMLTKEEITEVTRELGASSTGSFDVSEFKGLVVVVLQYIAMTEQSAGASKG